MMESESSGRSNTLRQVGVLFTATGVFFFLVGVVMLFDSVLLIMSNLLFVFGVCFIIGFGRVGSFFFQPSKRRGTICFIFGFIIILVFHIGFIGAFFEVFGVLNLFGDFFPMLLAAARKVPYLGDLLSMPGIKQFLDRLIVGESLPL